MYHFDYVGKRGGAVFEDRDNGNMVILNDQKIFTFNQFINTFVLIENYKHPFTITTTEKRIKRLDKQLEKIGYIPTRLVQIDFDFGDENASVFGYYHVNSRNPFN